MLETRHTMTSLKDGPALTLLPLCILPRILRIAFDVKQIVVRGFHSFLAPAICFLVHLLVCFVVKSFFGWFWCGRAHGVAKGKSSDKKDCDVSFHCVIVWRVNTKRNGLLLKTNYFSRPKAGGKTRQKFEPQLFPCCPSLEQNF